MFTEPRVFRLHPIGLDQHNVLLLPFSLHFPTPIHIGKIELKLTPRIPQRVEKLLRVCSQNMLTEGGEKPFQFLKVLRRVLRGVTLLLFLSLSWPSPFLLPYAGMIPRALQKVACQRTTGPRLFPETSMWHVTKSQTQITVSYVQFLLFCFSSPDLTMAVESSTIYRFWAKINFR